MPTPLIKALRIPPVLRISSLVSLILLICAGSGSLYGLAQPGDEQTNSKKNIVFVVVDDLGWTDLSCYGSEFYNTPHVDRLAEQGIRFTNAYSASTVCSPTRAALMTGRHPVRVNITDWIKGHKQKDPILQTPEDRDELALEEVTFAEVLQENGYKTGYVGKWHLGETEAYWPEHQGFDVNFGGFSKGSPPGGYYSPYKNPRLKDGPEREYLTDRLTNEAIGFVRENQENPFLLYLAFYTVHTPIQGSDKWDEYYEGKRSSLTLEDKDASRPEGPARTRLHQSHAKYAAMVRSMDENVGRLLAELEQLELADDTIVVFTSDNGGLSTQANHLAPTSVLPLRAGKGWCYEGGIRIPLIIRAPGYKTQGAESSQPTISMDLFPTLMDLAGLPQRPDLHLDGLSLAPAIADPELQAPRTLVWHYPHYHGSAWTPGTAIRVGDWKLIERYETGSLELYNLADDLGEQKDLASENPEMLSHMKNTLDSWLTSMDAKRPFPIHGENK